MSTPTADARAALDNFIKSLARAGDGLNLDDFRTKNIKQAEKTARKVRLTLYFSGLFFIITVFAEIFAGKLLEPMPLLWITFWAISLGGLGSIASIFLLIMKLIPQETLRSTDEVEVIGRIFLGCLFSLVLCTAIIPKDLMDFFTYFNSIACAHSTNDAGNNGSGIKLLLPFLCGYSIPLVLGLLGKLIRAVELTIGLEDRREAPQSKGARRR